jgi:hypothetical protein
LVPNELKTFAYLCGSFCPRKSSESASAFYLNFLTMTA